MPKINAKTGIFVLGAISSFMLMGYEGALIFVCGIGVVWLLTMTAKVAIGVSAAFIAITVMANFQFNLEALKQYLTAVFMSESGSTVFSIGSKSIEISHGYISVAILILCAFIFYLGVILNRPKRPKK